MANIINNEKWNKIIITILGIDIENITLLNKFELEINLFSMEDIINNKRWIKTIITLLGTDISDITANKLVATDISPMLSRK